MTDERSEDAPVRRKSRRSADTIERPGGQIGRFVVVSRLGEGAMGMVYLAYDPKLDRRLALKVLHRRRRSQRALAERQQRLRREAQAMAQLNHGNVVTVHDVGVADERVFLAMDYIDGQTLRQWLDAGGHGWRQVLDVVLAAGRGLAAAHEAGVIHRDFKPENVLVGKDGAVKVMDFGLARPRGDGPSSIIEPEPSDEASDAEQADAQRDSQGWWQEKSGLISVEGPPDLTRSGDVLGTPTYMAPELFEGGDATASSDQFALCVVLYEGLCGVRPFAGESMAAIAFNINQGQFAPAQPGKKPPAWLMRVIKKGLAIDPHRRHGSVQALCDALEQGLGRRRTRLLGLTTAGVAVGAAGLAYALVPTPPPCGGAADRIAQVWNEPRAEAIAEAFEATKVPYAEQTLVRARERIERYATDWQQVYTEVCEATAVHATQSPAELDRRIACLDERLTELDALLEVLGDADRRVAERAAAAASGLREPSICQSSTLSPHPTVEDPAQQGEFDRLRGELLRAEALERAGRYDDAIAASEVILEAATGLGSVALQAEALIQLGVANDMRGSYEPASAHLRRAYFMANEAGLDLLAARAAVSLITTEGIHLARSDDGLDWIRHAEAAFERSDTNDVLRGKFHTAVGSLRHQRFELDEARSHYEKALVIERDALGEDHETVASLLAMLGAVQEQSGRSEDAVHSFERALAIHRAALGPRHPQLAALHNNYAVVLFGRRDLAGAQAQLEQALAIYRETLGEHPATALFLDNLGGLMLLGEQLEEGRALIEEGLAMREQVLGPEHPAVANSLLNLGNAYELAKDWGAAQRTYERSLTLMRKGGDPDNPQMARAIFSLGVLALREGAVSRGYEQCLLSVEILERVGGRENPDLVGPLAALGWAQLELQQPQGALDILERAYTMKDQGQADAPALTSLLLAQALTQTGGDAERAKALRAEARAFYKGSMFEPPERVAKWLDDPQ